MRMLPVTMLILFALFSAGPGVLSAGENEATREAPLEGEALKRYEEEFKRYKKKLSRIREQPDLLAYMEKLGTSGSRAGRDALIYFAARSKNAEAIKHAFYHLVATKDPVAIRFVCGKDGILSRRENSQILAFQAMWQAKSPAIAAPILEVLEAPRMNIDIKTGLVETIAPYARDNTDVLAALMKYAVKGPHQLRAMALKWLGAAHDEKATELLLNTASKSRSSKDRLHAWIGLRDTKRRDLLPRLRRMAGSERQSAVREEAATTIKRLEALPVPPPEPSEDKSK